MKKVMIAMSGGVDSSVAAAILKEQGYDVAGVTMQQFHAGNTAVADAKLVADALSIPHYAVDTAEFFERSVIGYFVDEYKSGRTPNPCVVCNRRLKFGLLMDKAMELGYDAFATGHYAIIDNGNLRRGVDMSKDQSYFLYPILTTLTSSPGKIIFPLGGITKNEARILAKKFNLPAAEKGDSQDICFVTSGNYSDILKEREVGEAGNTGGHIVDMDGNILGRHSGIHNFTVGQRKGLGALGTRMYVKQINADDNTVVAAEAHQLGSCDIVIRDVIYSDREIHINDSCSVQIRYRSAPVCAKVAGMDTVAGTLRLKFNAPVRAVSPGQSAVIYDGDIVIAGGVIC